MTQEKYPFTPKQAGKGKTDSYLGSDGLPITQTYKFYLKKCDEFKMKARKYAKHNLRLQNSILHQIKFGYKSSETLEEEVLLERESHIKLYRKDFIISYFEEDPYSMYECFTGKSKKIRIIRELHQGRIEEYSDYFDNKKVSWFTRYCILSKFIQGARKVIMLNRLRKVLSVLRGLTPEMIQKAENEVGKEIEKVKINEGVHLKQITKVNAFDISVNLKKKF